jgi:hypothetical protein
MPFAYPSPNAIPNISSMEFVANSRQVTVTLGSGVAPANGTPIFVSDTLLTPANGNFIIESGVLWQYSPAPSSYAAAANISAANVVNSIIQYTGTAGALTLPSGSQLDAVFPSSSLFANVSFDMYIINTGAGTATLGGNTGVTIVGVTTVVPPSSAHFRLRRTGTATYVAYRLSP